MSSGAALAARATPPDPIEDDRAAPRPAANAGRHPRPVPLAESAGRRGQASAPARPAPDPVSDRYLAPALKAAAAARARSARIRADVVAVQAPRDPGPAGRALPPLPPAPRDPGPARHEMPPPPPARYGWSMSEKAPAAPPPWAPAPDAGRRFGGLSVAAAARAATIAFQPVRRPAAAAAPADPPAAAEPTAQAALRAPEPEPGPLPAPAQRPAAEPARAAGDGGQRFARTVSESRRYLATCGAHEAGSGLVPRPTLPLSDPEPTGRSWLRLWSRR